MKQETLKRHKKQSSEDRGITKSMLHYSAEKVVLSYYNIPTFRSDILLHSFI